MSHVNHSESGLFKKQSIIAIKVSVNIAKKYNAKAKKFIILIFYFPVFFLRSHTFCNFSTISFSITVSLFFEDFFKASRGKIIINKT